MTEEERNGETTGEASLSAGVSQFVESMGLLMEKYGLPRIGGRILGLLMLQNEPQSLDDLTRLLGVSRASISTNVRMSEASGLVERVTRPGDRRDYYQGVDDMGIRSLQVHLQELLQMDEAAHKALPNIPDDDTVALARLHELIDFCEFWRERMEQIIDEWQTYKVRQYGTNP